jgi:RND family efflux transporter MFP subunit
LALGVVGVVAGIAAALVLAVRYRDAAPEGQAAVRRERGPALVRVVKPELQNMSRIVGQPGVAEAYEQTAIFSKVSGFIKKFTVDIGDQVKKDQVLCEIFDPELVQEHAQKVAQVTLDREGIRQARELVEVAKANRETATAQVTEALANVRKYDADVARWTSELDRDLQMVTERALEKQVGEESRKTLQSSKAACDAAKETVKARKAAEKSAAAQWEKAQIDVTAAEAQLKVSEAQEGRLAALLAYTKLTAPYDGVVTVRNANTGDYVESVSGEKTASSHVPVFVVARTDLVRIFVDVPEESARYVDRGTKASVRADALNGLEISTAVARTSWSISKWTRELRAELDLPVAQSGIRPGMYVYAYIVIEHPHTFVVPQEACVVLGNETYAFLLEGDRAVKTSIQYGIKDHTRMEVTKKKVGESWQPVTGSERFILGELADMVDGQAVAAAAPKSR